MPVPQYRAPKDNRPWGLLGDIGRFISPPGYTNRGPFGARSALAATGEGDPTLSRYGTPGTQTADYNAWRRGGGGTPPPPLDLPAPITSPNTTFQRADEEYKTLLSQYGGTSGVQQLAGMQSLPTGFTPTGGKQAAGLEDYYAAQRAVGSKNIGEITGALASVDPRYQKGGTLERWAIANPMLAMREYNEKFPAGAPTTGPSDAEIAAAQKAGQLYSGAGSAQPSVVNQTSFAGIGNAVPAPPQQQGAAVSAPYAPANAIAAEKTAGATGMPNLQTTAQPQTTLDKVSGFLNGITPIVKTLFPAGVGTLFGPKF